MGVKLRNDPDPTRDGPLLPPEEGLADGTAPVEADADRTALGLANAAAEADGDGTAGDENTGRASNGALHDPNPVFVIKSSAPAPEILIPDNMGLSFPGTRPMLITKLPPP